MKKRNVIVLVLVGLLALVFFGIIAGCGGGISQKTRDKAEQLTKAADATNREIGKYQDRYKKGTKTADYKGFLAVYAEREKLTDKFQTARNRVKEGQSILKNDVQPLLDKNDSESESKVVSLLDRVQAKYREATTDAKYPGNRMVFLLNVRKNAPAMVATARKETQSASGTCSGLGVKVEEVKKTFPEKGADLDRRFGIAQSLLTKSNEDLKVVEKELAAASRDYANLGDGCTRITGNLSGLKKYDKELRGKMEELSHSYTKTLADAKVRYFVTIGRSDWSESSEFDDATDHTYDPREVDSATYDYFDKVPEDAEWSNNESYTTYTVDENRWNTLNIDPAESLSGDTYSFWVSDTPVKYYFKYEVNEDGKKSKTDWTEVDEATFNANEENIGMEILSKPYGKYEEEVDKQASPPGMGFVGNPRYGHWQTDTSGHQVWEWFGMWAFYSSLYGGNHRYSYDEWNDWNRNYRGRKAYYGNDDQYGTYGSYGGVRSTEYYRSGEVNPKDISVRGAGAAARGGGPGGGGK